MLTAVKYAPHTAQDAEEDRPMIANTKRTTRDMPMQPSAPGEMVHVSGRPRFELDYSLIPALLFDYSLIPALLFESGVLSSITL